MDGEVTPLLRLMDVDRVVEATKNSNFGKAEAEFETLLRDTIDTIYANPSAYPDPDGLLSKFRRLVEALFPEDGSIGLEERYKRAEEHIKLVYLMQFMDAWTFDSKRLCKCSCQHILPDGRLIPSCGYYTFHRRFDTRFQNA